MSDPAATHHRDPRRIPRALSIAGSDSGGGAGIQADLKAFAACGVHGMTAITAITAQNTVAVTAVHPVPPEIILAQVRAVSCDIGVDAIKIGMLGDAVTVEAVREALDELSDPIPVVLDPVMVAESGATLLDPAARGALLELLAGRRPDHPNLPRVTVLTPNVPEALVLLGRDPADANDLHLDTAALAKEVHRLGPANVVVTGGHRADPTDVFHDGSEPVPIGGTRQPDGAAHGSGCTHSSVLAARLAHGDPPLQAARVAKQVAERAVRDGLRELGSGAGPVDVLGLTTRPADHTAVT